MSQPKVIKVKLHKRTEEFPVTVEEYLRMEKEYYSLPEKLLVDGSTPYHKDSWDHRSGLVNYYPIPVRVKGITPTATVIQ